MPRTTAEVLDQLERFLPAQYRAYRAVLAGGAAGIADADRVWAELAAASMIGDADGVFLKLRARGFDVYPQPGESDEAIRGRIRTIEGQVTRPAILDAVNALLSPYTDIEADMVERMDSGWIDGDDGGDSGMVLDDDYVCDWPRHFVLVVPLLEESGGIGPVLEEGALDADLIVAASGGHHPVYDAIRALVDRIRAAGIRVSVAFEEE